MSLAPGTVHPYRWKVVGMDGQILRDLDEVGRPTSVDAEFRRKADAQRISRRYRRGGTPAAVVPHRLEADKAIAWANTRGGGRG